MRPEDSTVLQQRDREYETALGQEGSIMGQASTPTRAAQALASPGALGQNKRRSRVDEEATTFFGR